MTEEAYPGLSVRGQDLESDIELDEISGRLGCSPRSPGAGGTPSGTRGSLTRTVAGSSGFPPALPSISRISWRSFLSQLEPRKAEVAALARDSKFTARSSCVGYMATIVPAVYFENELLDRVAALGLDLDVDLFLVPNESLTPR